MRKKVVVIGVGKLGSAIAAEASLEGDDVIAVDKNPSSFSRLPVSFSGMEFEGDVLNIRILEQLKLEEAKEVTITTEKDDVNILLGFICAKRFEVPTIYIRLGDVEKAKLIDDKRINCIFPFNLSLEEYKKIRTREQRKNKK